MNRAYSLFEIKEFNEESRILRGMATTPTPDRIGDVVVSTGVRFMPSIPLFLYHDSRKSVGTVRFSKATDGGIPFEASLPHVVEPGNLRDRVDEAWQMVKYKLITGVSIGFNPIEKKIEQLKSGGLKYLECEVLELSLVPIPMNAEATITQIKSLDESHLAATGRKLESVVRLAVLPGASGRKQTNPKGTEMKTIQEQLSSFESKRAASAARMSEIMASSADQGRTLDETETEEYDGLQAEVKSVDDHLVRLRTHEKTMRDTAIVVTDIKTPEQASTVRGGGVITVKSNLPKGTGFTRYAMALAKSHGNLMQAVEIAKQWHDSTPEVEMMLKAAVAAGTTTDTTWAAPLALPNTMAGEFVDLLRPATIVGRIPGLRRIPFNVRMPRATAGSTANWVGQGAPKPVSRMSFDTMTMAFTKVAAIIVLTEELVRFSTPAAEAVVQDDMIKAISQFIDKQFIDPTVSAVAGVNPASITNGLTLHNSTGTTLAQVLADVGTLMAPFFTGNLAPSVWIMNPRTAFSLSQLRTAQDIFVFPQINAQGGTLMGLPVITSNNVPINTAGQSIIVLMDASEVFLADDGGVTLDVSREASVQMDSAPTAGATTSVSLWQNNMVGLRAERFINWQARRGAAVSLLSAVTY